jgi:hypothetical protein
LFFLFLLATVIGTASWGLPRSMHTRKSDELNCELNHGPLSVEVELPLPGFLPADLL